MAIEVHSSTAICCRCGLSYGRRRGNFSVNYGQTYKGIGFLPVCKDCVDKMYNSYLSQCNNARDAVRQVCRKLDLYWNDKAYAAAENKNTPQTVMTGYLSKISSAAYSGKSYDDTLSEEGTLWLWNTDIHTKEVLPVETYNDPEPDDDFEISQEIIDFWGRGYKPEMYRELEQRRAYWMSKFPEGTELDIGTEAIIRQICPLELDIVRDRAAGRSVDKSINALNTLLGSGNLKPVQNKSDDGESALDKTPLGVWAHRIEYKHPVKEIDPEFQDVDGIAKYVTTWFFGHLCKMLNIKNSYCKLYEDEIARMRLEHPEYDDEDDETLLSDVLNYDRFEIEDSEEDSEDDIE